MKRIKTRYPGVFFREADRIGGKGKEKVFYILFKKDGKLLEEKAGRQYADNMTEAKAARFRGERIEGKRKSRKEIREERKQKKAQPWTFDRLWEEYKKTNPGLKGLVQDENRFTLHVSPALGKKEPRDLVPLDIDRIRIALQKKKKDATVRNVLEIIRRIINFGIKKRLCPGPAFKVALPRVNNLKTEMLTEEQIKKVMEVATADKNTNAAGMVKLGLSTGLRRGEMFKLKWSDIDFQTGFITLKDTKGGTDQKVFLNDMARKVLENHPRLDESPFVFPGRGGKQLTDISKAVRRIRDNAGLPKDFRPLHGHRHSFASLLISSGEVDLYRLQKLLTQKDPRMTQRYAHLSDVALKSASNVAASLIQDALNAEDKADEK